MHFVFSSTKDKLVRSIFPLTEDQMIPAKVRFSYTISLSFLALFVVGLATLTWQRTLWPELSVKTGNPTDFNGTG